MVSESIGFLEILGMIIYAGLITAAVFLFKKYKLVSFGIVWFLLCMFVESGIIPIRDLMMEHRLYLPMFGLMGIDWGYGFDEVPGVTDAAGSQFHFVIGQQF